MNVFGKNERSWRKARKRGVSPIIATILLVAITVVLAAVLYVLISGLTGGGVGSKPIGTAITVGPNPSPSATLCTAKAGACLGATDYVYILTVESSSVTFGNVLFQVKTAAGAFYTGVGVGAGFSIISTTNGIAASDVLGAVALAMPSSSWTVFGAAGVCTPVSVGCSGSTLLTNLYTIGVDVGTTNPAGQGLTFTIAGASGYTGTTGVLTLS